MPCSTTHAGLMDARSAEPLAGTTPFDPTQSSRDALHHLLDEVQAYAPEHHQGLSNHLPMALSALHGLGASPARMRAFFDRHVRVLEAGDQPGSPATPVDDWAARRGRPEAFGALRAHFHAALAWEGRDAVLHQTLPLLMEAPAASFHGLIRTAHAIESDHAAEWRPASRSGPPVGSRCRRRTRLADRASRGSGPGSKRSISTARGTTPLGALRRG